MGLLFSRTHLHVENCVLHWPDLKQQWRDLEQMRFKAKIVWFVNKSLCWEPITVAGITCDINNKKKFLQLRLIRKFHVVVVQERQRNVPKSELQVQILLFCLSNLLPFWRFVAIAVVVAKAPLRGALATTKATAAKTSPKKRIRAASNFIDLNATLWICQMLAIFSGVEF